MIPPNLVKAEVVDLTCARRSFPQRAILDANILYFVYYPNFSALSAAQGRTPLAYQLRVYPRWFKEAAQNGMQSFASVVTVGEFARAMEFAEWEAYCRTLPGSSMSANFGPIECKAARYDHHGRLLYIRNTSDTVVNVMRKSVGLLPKMRNEVDELQTATQAWIESAGDFADSIMVATAKFVGIREIVSDDVDLITFDGIQVYTANRNAIQAASVAGKLIP